MAAAKKARKSGTSGKSGKTPPSPDPSRPSLKDPDYFDELEDRGMSEQKAARISNAAAREGKEKVGERGGKAENLPDRTVPELRQRAKELGLSGYSKLRKDELIDLIRNS